ncbi:DUF1192 domain-containing protein [Ancylobacter sp. 6x-1]|uniref:DUF1192 domain-containing protein n=1 Tax=Ancylobacter crimeensis TaxID=2579147 RepID=A0ABT0DE98_9HYPH|nr:DUF1192 domain-containing protein [Ancylobacter crimeensis]MCK0198284.1 DUF1192 domain-containing protein [Ancylobacter crimeensis]
MSMEDEPRRVRPAIEVGADISTLSETEIEERIAALAAEIERLKTALSAKKASRAAADLFFKR